MHEKLSAKRKYRAVLQHPTHESPAFKLSVCPLHLSPHISMTAILISFLDIFGISGLFVICITDLQDLSHNSVRDCVLPLLGQTVCLGLTVSFLHQILCIHCSHFPLHPFTFPHVNLESEERRGKGSHLIVV